MIMAPAEHCHRCGTALDETGPLERLCARCLLTLALNTTDRPTSTVSPESVASGRDVPEPIGPYRLLSKLGEGGMGVVYLAKQTAPLRRRVALKVIKRGMDSAEVIARFESERQALALLNHPGIAKVYDAGTTDEGLPYFVMEHVPGVPITEYCDRNRLTMRDRLALLAEVCDAVQHAHARGIIHRDIKPQNVLVSDEDGVRRPKVIDFGVAKATQQRLTEKTLFTALGVVIGTPGYTSPEQAEITGLDVDDRSDIYSLGVLAYELLVGTPPFDARRLRQAGWAEMQRIIREEEPSRPSRRVTALGDAATEVARRRGTEATVLARQLRGDLDWITLKALEKDRTRRYQSAAELGADIRRYLGEEPVLAGPPGLARRMRRIVRRRRAAVLAGAVALAAAAAVPLLRPNGFPLPEVVSLTTFAGAEFHPALSPDGTRLAFTWNGEKQDNFDIYVKDVAAGPPRRLTTHPAVEYAPAWSPHGGHLAFAREALGAPIELFVMPAGGGPERRVAEISASVRHLDWSPDGRYLVTLDEGAAGEKMPGLFLISTADGSKRRLTSSPNREFPDDHAAFSPDGRSVAFVRTRDILSSDVWVLGLRAEGDAPSGEPRRITAEEEQIVGIAWTPDGREMVFAMNDAGQYRLFRVPASGGPARAVGVAGTTPGVNVVQPSVSRHGNRLAYHHSRYDTDIWRLDVPRPVGRARPAWRVISSTRQDTAPQISKDGRTVAFETNRHGGAVELWTCGLDGSNPLPVMEPTERGTGSPAWSPDGQRIAFDSRREGSFDIFVVDANGTGLRRLTVDAGEDVVPAWSPDGRWIYFSSNRTGTFQIWKVSAEGGPEVRVTKGGGFGPVTSADGEFVYYTKTRAPSELWRIPAHGGDEARAPGSVSVEWGHWALANEGFFHMVEKGEGATTRTAISFYDFAAKTTTEVAELERDPDWGPRALAVSADGRTILYVQTERNDRDIMLVENFR
jgi:Tol biopolymer transport system component/serine/threonine protein kinase